MGIHGRAQGAVEVVGELVQVRQGHIHAHLVGRVIAARVEGLRLRRAQLLAAPEIGRAQPEQLALAQLAAHARCVPVAWAARLEPAREGAIRQPVAEIVGQILNERALAVDSRPGAGNQLGAVLRPEATGAQLVGAPSLLVPPVVQLRPVELGAQLVEGVRELVRHHEAEHGQVEQLGPALVVDEAVQHSARDCDHAAIHHVVGLHEPALGYPLLQEGLALRLRRLAADQGEVVSQFGASREAEVFQKARLAELQRAVNGLDVGVVEQFVRITNEHLESLSRQLGPLPHRLAHPGELIKEREQLAPQ